MDHLQSWPQIFSDQTEMVRSIWWINRNYWNFTLNEKRPGSRGRHLSFKKRWERNHLTCTRSTPSSFRTGKASYQHFEILLCFVKCFCVSFNFVVYYFPFVFYQIVSCSRKNCCSVKLCFVLEKIVVFSERLFCCAKDCSVPSNCILFSRRLLCSRKDCCVLQKIVVFWKRLLCFLTGIALCFAPMGHRNEEGIFP